MQAKLNAQVANFMSKKLSEMQSRNRNSKNKSLKSPAKGAAFSLSTFDSSAGTAADLRSGVISDSNSETSKLGLGLLSKIKPQNKLNASMILEEL